MSSATCSCSSDGAATSQTDCGRLPKSIQDDLDTFELLAEMWVTVGISGPLFLTIIVTVMTLMGETAIPVLGVWFVPVTVAGLVGAFLILSEYIWANVEQMDFADKDIQARVHSELRMYVVISLVGGLVAVSVLGMLETTFLTKMAEMPATPEFNTNAAELLTGPIYATMIIQAAGTGLIAGSIGNASPSRRVLYALGLTLLAGLVIFA